MKIELSNLLKGIRHGKTNCKELSLLVKAINKTNKNKQILEGIQTGLSGYSDKEIEWLADLLGKGAMK